MPSFIRAYVCTYVREHCVAYSLVCAKRVIDVCVCVSNCSVYCLMIPFENQSQFFFCALKVALSFEGLCLSGSF